MNNCEECKQKQRRIDQFEEMLERMKVSAAETHQRVSFIGKGKPNILNFEHKTHWKDGKPVQTTIIQGVN